VIEQDIREFNKQFGFRPEFVNAESFQVATRVVLGGMGGSHLSADLLKMLKSLLRRWRNC